jgi:hypothetical protein
MLFYAFEMLYEMYLEQGDVAEKYIPREILKHNLYGIDIDPGAAQLAALSLYVKAKTEEPDVEIEQINIVSADAVLVNGEKKQEVLARVETELEERVLEQVWQSFEHIREWGSLVRIEERIEDIIEEELKEIRATGQTQFTERGLEKQSSVVSFSGGEESWEQVKERLLEQVSELAEEALEQNDPIEEMFVGEVEKSVQLLDYLVGEYDVVISNPPYLNSAKMGDNLKNYLKDNYHGYRDIYASFIERSINFVREDNYISLLTPETYMYLDSFKDLRPLILEKTNIVESAHYSHRDTDYMNISTILRPSDTNNVSRFIRLINSNEKRDSLNNITKSHKNDSLTDRTYDIDQEMFNNIKNKPFVYWFGSSVISAFEEGTPLNEVVDSQSGLKSGNNKKFLFKYWEIDSDKIGEKYRPVAHSENSIGYHDQTSFVVEWVNNGENIEIYGDENGHQYYFGDKTQLSNESVGFQVNSKYFISRYIPDDHIPINQLYVVIPEEKEDILYMNGLLNSSLIKYIINGFNPSANFTQGDVFRLPYKYEKEADQKISELVEIIIRRIDEMAKLDETNLEFDPMRFFEILRNFDSRIYDSLAYELDLIRADRHIIGGLVDNHIFDVYDIDNNSIEEIYAELPQNLADLPHLKNAGDLYTEQYPFRNKIETKSISSEEYDTVVGEISELRQKNIRKIAEETGVSPHTVANIRKKQDLYTKEEKQDIVGSLLSYYIGCIFDWWDGLPEVDKQKEGILVFDNSFDNNVESKIRECIEASFDDIYKQETEIENILNREISTWLQQTFFRYHHCKEYRRRGQRNPIYWQLESDEGAFSCLIYYHAMDANTFAKLRGQYIDKKLDELQNRLEVVENDLNEAEGDRARDLRSVKENVQADIDDITQFRDRLDNLINEGFEPSFEEGIWKDIQQVDEHDLLAVPLDKL